MIATAKSSEPSRATTSTRYRVVTKPVPGASDGGPEKKGWPTVGVAFVNRGKDGREYIRVKLDEGAESARELYLFVHEPKKGAEEQESP